MPANLNAVLIHLMGNHYFVQKYIVHYDIVTENATVYWIFLRKSAFLCNEKGLNSMQRKSFILLQPRYDKLGFSLT